MPFVSDRVAGKMLRFYTLGRANEATIDEVLAVEGHVLVVRPSALSNLSEVVAGRFRRFNPLISCRQRRLEGVSKNQRLAGHFRGVRRQPRKRRLAVLFCCLVKLCLIPPSMAVKKKTARHRDPRRHIGKSSQRAAALLSGTRFVALAR